MAVLFCSIVLCTAINILFPWYLICPILFFRAGFLCTFLSHSLPLHQQNSPLSKTFFSHICIFNLYIYAVFFTFIVKSPCKLFCAEIIASIIIMISMCSVFDTKIFFILSRLYTISPKYIYFYRPLREILYFSAIYRAFFISHISFYFASILF